MFPPKTIVKDTPKYIDIVDLTNDEPLQDIKHRNLLQPSVTIYTKSGQHTLDEIKQKLANQATIIVDSDTSQSDSDDVVFVDSYKIEDSHEAVASIKVGKENKKHGIVKKRNLKQAQKGPKQIKSIEKQEELHLKDSGRKPDSLVQKAPPTRRLRKKNILTTINENIPKKPKLKSQKISGQNNILPDVCQEMLHHVYAFVLSTQDLEISNTKTEHFTELLQNSITLCSLVNNVSESTILDRLEDVNADDVVRWSNEELQLTSNK